jgi:transposase
MKDRSTFVGLDTHKAMIQVCVFVPEREKPIEWEIPHEAGAIRRMAKKILREACGAVKSCYEAGPCGYALQRTLMDLGVSCDVVAPSLIPVKPGERIKTDRRDARKLAELLRAGLLTTVHPPTKAEEAVRDLCRAREDVLEDLGRARHRLAKLLLRRGLIWEGAAWTQRHAAWVRGLKWETPEDEAVVADYLLGIEQLQERMKTLEGKLEIAVSKDPYREPVAWLRCLRGIDTVTAVTIVAELHDFRRFHSPRELMAYLGLVPSEHSSGEGHRRGSITKAGNSHVRRVLIEASWHYRHPYRVGAALKERRKGQPAHVVTIADKAGQRLNRRFFRLGARGKPACKIVTAVARELAGFVWAMLYPRALQKTS